MCDSFANLLTTSSVGFREITVEPGSTISKSESEIRAAIVNRESDVNRQRLARRLLQVLKMENELVYSHAKIKQPHVINSF